MRNFIVTAVIIALVTAMFVLFGTIIETGGNLDQYVTVIFVITGIIISPAFYNFD